MQIRIELWRGVVVNHLPPPPPRCFLQAIFRVLIPTVFTSTNPEVIFLQQLSIFMPNMMKNTISTKVSINQYCENALNSPTNECNKYSDYTPKITIQTSVSNYMRNCKYPLPSDI